MAKSLLSFKWSNLNFHPISLKCDSILNNKPYFSLFDNHLSQFSQLIIEKLDNSIMIKYPHNYQNGTLNLFFVNNQDYRRIHFIFDDNIQYSIYLQKGFDNLFTLYIMDVNNNKRYVIEAKELYKILQKYKTPDIHKDLLEQYSYTGYIDLDRNSKFELVKENFIFKNKLVIDINKTLFE